MPFKVGLIWNKMKKNVHQISQTLYLNSPFTLCLYKSAKNLHHTAECLTHQSITSCSDRGDNHRLVLRVRLISVRSELFQGQYAAAELVTNCSDIHLTLRVCKTKKPRQNAAEQPSFGKIYLLGGCRCVF